MKHVKRARFGHGVRIGVGGTSLVEVLVAVAISSVCLAIAYGSVIIQSQRQMKQAAVSEAQHASRVAFDVLTQQLANVGFGVPGASSPSAAPAIVAAEPTKLTFWTNTRTDHTYLTSAVAKANSTINVLSTSGMAAGTSVYVTDDTQWFLATVRSVSGTAVQLAQPTTVGFAAGSLVLPVEQVTFSFADGTAQRNGHPFIHDVTALSFTYDATTLENIRVITISMTMRSRVAHARGTRQSFTLGARIAPPNLAL